MRRPDLVVSCGCRLLETHSLGDDKWSLLEQVLVAALDTGDMWLADTCLGNLLARFPDSNRVRRLHGMFK